MTRLCRECGKRFDTGSSIFWLCPDPRIERQMRNYADTCPFPVGTEKQIAKGALLNGDGGKTKNEQR